MQQRVVRHPVAQQQAAAPCQNAAEAAACAWSSRPRSRAWFALLCATWRWRSSPSSVAASSSRFSPSCSGYCPPSLPGVVLVMIWLPLCSL